MPTVFFNDIFKNCFGAFWFCAVEARLERTPSKSRNGRPTNSQCSVFHAKCCRKTCSRSSHNFDETSSSAEKRSETLRNDGVGNECLWSFWPRGLCWTFECLWSQVQQPEPKQSPSREILKTGFQKTTLNYRVPKWVSPMWLSVTWTFFSESSLIATRRRSSHHAGIAVSAEKRKQQKHGELEGPRRQSGFQGTKRSKA